jgi:lactate permease
MPWTPTADPFGSLPLSALVAALPLAALFALLASGRVKGWVAALASTGVAFALATSVWGMPAAPAVSAAVLGAVFALFPILWILAAALWVHSLGVESGQFEIIKQTLASVTPDRRLQALLIAFAFGAFLEGTAGFGVPVAITSAMLIGLGFPPVTAALVCLLANSTPVAFAAAGVPITVAAEVARVDPLAVGRTVARLLPVVSLFLPAWLCVVLSGWRRAVEVLPAALVAGVTLAVSQLVISATLGPWSTGVVSGLATMAALLVFLRLWRPKGTWDFSGGGAAASSVEGGGKPLPFGRALRAWSPWLLTSAFVLAWSTGPVKDLLAATSISIRWPLLGGTVFSLPLASTPGTAIFLAGVASVFLLPGLGPRQAIVCLGRTLRGMRLTVLTVCLVLATAYIMNHAAMSASIGLALAATGAAFPVFSALLGWIGVVLTGSDTSSNALFCGLQRAAADALGLDPAVMAGANTAGGVTGKMVSPQNLSVATASTGLAGQEGLLFRKAIGHSAAMAIAVGLLTLALVRL